MSTIKKQSLIICIIIIFYTANTFAAININSLRSLITHKETEKHNLQEELINLRTNIKQNNSSIIAAQQSINTIEKTNSSLKMQLDALQLKLQKYNHALKQGIKYSYQIHLINKLKIFLQSHNVSTLKRIIRSMSILNRHNAAEYSVIQANITALNSKSTMLTQNMDALAKQKKLEINRLATIEEQQEIIFKKIHQVQSTLENTTELLKIELNKIEHSRSQSQKTTSIPTLTWPIANMQPHKLRGNHAIITAKSGKILAIAPGEIVFADSLKGLKKLIIIDHGNSLLSLYGHNDVLYKKVGDAVAAGEIIGTINSNPQDIGLYFELRKHGKALDLASSF